MRAPSFIAIASAAAMLAACSRAQPRADDSIQRDLDLALSSARNNAVASEVEIGKLPRPKPPAVASAPEGSHTAHAMREMRRPAVEQPAPAPAHVQRASEPEATAPVATASEPDEPAVTPVDPDPTTNEPAPEPEPRRTGRGGWYPVPIDIGVGRGNGTGGIIIIRGGAGNGDDPCAPNEPGHGGMGPIGGVIGGVLGGILGHGRPGGR